MRKTIVAGPCAVESEEQIHGMARKISKIRDATESYGIDFKIRGGAWKPRTSYVQENNGGARIFEGTGLDGLKWLAEAGNKFNLPVVSELMSENDIRHFHRYLDYKKDFIQIGARTNQAYALLYIVGGTDFSVVLKNAMHGVDPKEAEGSLKRLEKNRRVVYCTRGSVPFVHPSGRDNPEHATYMKTLRNQPNQHPDSRNINNIECIESLKKYFQNINELSGLEFWHDSSHTWGGRTHLMRRKIGEYAARAITEFGYDGIIMEVNDLSRTTKCDADQALLTTSKGIDWSKTYVKEKPPKDMMPITLVDIVGEVMKHQAGNGFGNIMNLKQDQERLYSLKF